MEVEMRNKKMLLWRLLCKFSAAALIISMVGGSLCGCAMHAESKVKDTVRPETTVTKDAVWENIPSDKEGAATDETDSTADTASGVSGNDAGDAGVSGNDGAGVSGNEGNSVSGNDASAEGSGAEASVADTAKTEAESTSDAQDASAAAASAQELPHAAPEEYASLYEEIQAMREEEYFEGVSIDPSELTDYTMGSEEKNIAPTIIKNPVMNIAVLGDSQFGNFKDYNGMAYMLSEYCKANVFNFSIGGTTCAVSEKDPVPTGDVNDNVTGIGMMYAILGQIPLDFLKKYEYVYNLFDICDFNDIDVFVIEYGVNDYLSKIPMTTYGTSLPNFRAYRQALQMMVSQLHSKFPNAKFVVCAPGYAQFFTGETYIGDSNILNNGYGRLIEYTDSACNVVHTAFDAAEVGLMNPYYDLEINPWTAQDYLLDGIHMNEAGRRIYAEMLARIIIRMQGYSIEAGVNPNHVDWLSTKETN